MEELNIGGDYAGDLDMDGSIRTEVRNEAIGTFSKTQDTERNEDLILTPIATETEKYRIITKSNRNSKCCRATPRSYKSKTWK